MAKNDGGDGVMPKNSVIDYRSGKIPDWVREVIDTQLAIETEDAKSAGALGFMARALVIATMPYKDPKVDAFVRQNGDFRLRIVAGYEGGIPFGIYPRLLMSWVSTEAVRNQSPVIELGDSLSGFLRDVLDVQRGGGRRGSSTRVSEQMKRLFGSLVTAQYNGSTATKDNPNATERRGFMLKNVLIAEELEVDEDEMASLWTPQASHEAGNWKSKVKLTESFFRECVTNPVPIDLRAYKALRGSPLAMDVYTWLTYRMSYTVKPTKPIPWESLMAQFGSNFNSEQAVRDFKKAFLKALKPVLALYRTARVDVRDNGLVLNPSPPHILPSNIPRQPDLF